MRIAHPRPVRPIIASAVVTIVMAVVAGLGLASFTNAVSPPTAAAAASCGSSYGYKDQWGLIQVKKPHTKSKNYYLNAFHKGQTAKYGFEVRPQQHVSSKRTFYLSISKLYANGSTTKLKSDRGYGDGGTDCLYLTMVTNQRYLLYASTASAKGKKPSHKRWVTVWRDKDGDVHSAG